MLPGALVVAAALALYTSRGFRLADFIVAFVLGHVLDLLLLAGIPWALPPRAPIPTAGVFAAEGEVLPEAATIPDSPFAAPRPASPFAERPAAVPAANPFAPAAVVCPEEAALPPGAEPAAESPSSSGEVAAGWDPSVGGEEQESQALPSASSTDGEAPTGEVQPTGQSPEAPAVSLAGVVSADPEKPASAAVIPGVPEEEKPEQPLNPS